MTFARNETQQHRAALKSAGQNPVGLLPLDNHSIIFTSGFLIYLNVCNKFLQHSKRERKSPMETNGYERLNHTIQECQDGLVRDMAEFSELYTFLGFAFVEP